MTAVNIDDLKAALAALTPKATSPSGARAIVEAIVEEIRAAMDKGYTYPEIAKLLAEQGLDLKPNTLRLYMQPKKTAHGQRTSRGRKVATGATRQRVGSRSGSALGSAPGHHHSHNLGNVHGSCGGNGTCARGGRGRQLAGDPRRGANGVLSGAAAGGLRTEGRRRQDADRAGAGGLA